MGRFKTELEDLKKRQKELEHSYSNIGTIRFLMFLVMLGGLIVGLYDSNIPFLAVGIVAVVIFVLLVFRHGKLNEELEYTKAKVIVYERYMKRYDDSWKGFAEDGSEYLTDDDLVAKDLDIMGKNSIYQFICVAGTEDGRQMLAETLRQPEFAAEDRTKRQIAIQELAEKHDFSMDFETLCVKSETGKKKKYSSDEFVAYCTFFVVLLFAWITSGVAGQAVMPMISFGYVINDYIRMFELVSGETFDSELLNDIKNTISTDSGALNAVKKLERISAAFNIRYNPIVHQVLCGLFLWDFHLGIMMDKWRDQYGSQVKDWIHAISRMEELLSFAVLARTREVSYPEVTRHEKVEVSAENLRHPLIDPSKVVPNDAAFKGGATIITGSNMSGKTTFLRTLGINLILAYAGAPVCAEKMHADYMKIFTSMRVTDDVSNGISTFYAEILRIKSMVEYKKNEMPMLCLIDEIFKGTNSADRIVGATQVIRKLSDDHSMTLVSTHDFELCELKSESGAPAANYHFEEYYEGDQLKFDYKKKDGRCTTTNAMAILHMAGLD